MADRPHTQHGERQNNTTNDTKGISEDNRQLESHDINIHGCGNVLYLDSCNSHDLHMQNCGNDIPLSKIKG